MSGYAEKSSQRSNASYVFEPAQESRKFYTVSQLNKLVGLTLKKYIGWHGVVSVAGEIGAPAIRTTKTGQPMVFFALHDDKEVINCKAWGRSLSRILTVDTETGEYYSEPKNPEEVFASERRVLIEGTLDVYAQGGRSVYQLDVFSVTDVGAGDRARQLKELKAKLSKEGFFSEDRKRPLPPNPSCVAVVTSPTGAVIHDFLRIARDRGMGARIILYPVPVQGTGAGQMIADAVHRAGHDGRSQVVVVIRGGGSEEDLACFNDEVLARAIFSCPVPVLAGIGHEPDYCLADMTADRRAPTPTAAAQYLWTSRADIRAGLDAWQDNLVRAMQRRIDAAALVLDQYEKLVRTLSPYARLKEQQHMTDDLARRLAMAKDRMLRSAGDDLARSAEALARTGSAFTDGRARSLERLALTLEALNPLAPLQRGYAYLEDEEGHVVRSVAGLACGRRIQAHVADGSVVARIEEILSRPEDTGAE